MWQRGKLLLILGLALLFGAPLSYGSAANLPLVESRVPEYARRLGDDIDLNQELVANRTPFSATFQDDDGVYTAVVSAEAMHYQDEEGAWQPIDPAFTSSPQGFAVEHNSIQSQAGLRQPWLGVRVRESAVVWEAAALGIVDDDGFKVLAEPVAEGVLPEQEEEGRVLRYLGGWSDPTVAEELISAADSIEHALVLQSAPGKDAQAEYLELQATLDLLPGASLWANGEQQEDSFATKDRIEVRNDEGQTAFVFDPVIAYEQADRGKAAAGEYLLEPSGEDGRWLVRVRTPYSWWAAPERQYPAVLDPTIRVLRSTGAFGDGLAWVGSDPEDNFFKSGEMVLGAYDFKPYETRAYMQFNSMPAVIKRLNGNVQGPLKIDKVFLDIAPEGLGVPSYSQYPGTYPNWHKIVHKRSATLHYIDVCPDMNCSTSGSTTFSMLDNRLANPIWNWNTSPKPENSNVHPVQMDSQGILQAGPFTGFEPRATSWDVTTEVVGWYENFYDLNTRLGPTFMLSFDQVCPSAMPYKFDDNPKVKVCTFFQIPSGNAQLRIEYTRPPVDLIDNSNILNTPGVPSFLEGVFEPEATHHQYELDTDNMTHWRGVAVRGNHTISETLPTKVGLKLKDIDLPLAQSNPSAPDQTVYMLMDGHNSDAGLSGKPITAEVTASNKNSFDQDQERNYRMEYVYASTWNVGTGSWENLPFSMRSDQLLNLIEIELGVGQNILITADGYPGLDIAFIKPTNGSALADGLIPVDDNRVNPLAPQGAAYRSLILGKVSAPGKWVLAITNQDRPEPDIPGDPDAEFVLRDIDINILICNAGSIATFKHACQPLRTADDNLMLTNPPPADLPSLGLKVYSPTFTVASPSEANDWCTSGEENGAPLIEQTANSDEWVAVAQGRICYTAATKTLTSTVDSGIGLMLPDPSIGIADRGSIAPTFIYGDTGSFPVPDGSPDGRVVINLESPGRLIPFANTWRRVQPFNQNWSKGNEYQHDLDYIDLATMEARSEGQVNAQVTTDANAAPHAVVWDVDWSLWPNLNTSLGYDYTLHPVQQTALTQPLDVASANLSLYGADFTTDADGFITELHNFDADSGPVAYQFFARHARLTNDIQLGGATKYIRAVVQPPGKALLPQGDYSCENQGQDTSCLDLRRRDYEWNNGDSLKAVQRWELPDITISDQIGSVTFAKDGELAVFSADHPFATQGVNNVSQSFAFDTWDVTATVSQGVCTPGGAAQSIINGKGKIALPMIGGDGSGPPPYIDVEFTLCETALRQAELTFGVVPDPIPVGSTGLGVDVIGGKVTVGPNSTRIAMQVGLLTTDGGAILSKGGTVKNGTVTIDTAGMFSLKGSGVIVGKLDSNFQLDVAWNPLDVLLQGDMSYGGGLITGYLRFHGWVGQGWQNKYSYLPDNNDFHFTGTIKAAIRIKKGQLIDKKYLKIPWFSSGFSAKVSFGEFCSNKSSCSPIRWGMSAAFEIFGYDVGVYVDKSGPDIFLGSSKQVLVDQCTSCSSTAPPPSIDARSPAIAPNAVQELDTAIIPPGADQPYMNWSFPDPLVDAEQIPGQQVCTGFDTATHTCSFFVDPAQPHPGRALFSAGWINGSLDVSLVAPGGSVITPANAEQNHVTITPFIDDDGLRQGINFAVNAATISGTIPTGVWQMILDGVGVAPQPINYYSLVFAADPPPPQISWTSVLSPQVTPVNDNLSLSWDVDRGGQNLEDNVTADLFYAPIYQAPPWESITASFPGSYMDEAGEGSDWDPAESNIAAGDPNQDGIWRIAANVPAGEYSFLVARDGDLGEYYGLNGLYQGRPISFTVPVSYTTPVKFYYDPRDNFATTDTEHTIVTLVGDMMSEISGGSIGVQDWDPQNLVGWMKPGVDSESFYETTLAVPAGQWEYKIAINESWGENYGLDGEQDGPAVPFEVPEGDALVRFTFDTATKEISHEILAETPGAMITRLNDPNAGTYNWGTSSLAEGEYRVGLRLDDHFQGNGQIISWAPGTVLLGGDNTPPPIPTILFTIPGIDSLDVHWTRDDSTADLAGYLVEYDLPGPEPDSYVSRTRRVLPLSQSSSPFSQHARLGGLLLSDPTLNIADIMTNVCVRAYDINDNVSGCSPLQVIMPTYEETPGEAVIGPPTLLQTQDGDPLEITWIPPDAGTAAGYLVAYTPTGCLVGDEYPPANEGVSPINVGDVLNTFINGLVQDQTYLIAVQAYTFDGVLSEAATVTGRTTDMTDDNNDGLPDAWAEIYGIDDPNEDIEGDGLSNFREASQATNPFNADSDGDGHYDGAELAWQTDLCGPEQPPYQAQPKLTLSGPDSLSFTAAHNLPQSDSQSISIFNMGQGTLNWTAVASDSWIQLSETSGQGLTELQISVNASGLQWWVQQEYEGIVTISSTHSQVQLPNGNIMPAITESFEIPVKLTLLPPVTGVTQAVGLDDGWNLISSYIEAGNTAVSAILSDVTGDLVLMKNSSGLVYWPAFGVDQIGDWDTSQSYQLYMAQNEVLTITGLPVDPALTPLTLPVGWNMPAYLRKEALPIGEALSSIEPSLLLVKDGEGQVYWPEYDINQIVDMAPGQGYQMYMVSPGSLTYPAN